MRPQVGQLINNKYKLVRVIGDGGMGSVYEASHEVLGTTVALKFLHPELSRRQGLVQRFLQEARVSAQIKSQHVVRVSDVDQNQNGQAFIVMEFLEGKTLQTLYEDLYNAGQRLSYADALEYAMQMIDGVEAAHKAGVVHRDLKPDNVMITRGPKGEPLIKILDFGIAKLKVTGELDRGLTRPGVIMGTPEYMAPEQAYSADAVDVRADIFSLGVMLFEMLAGRRPVGGDEPHQIASAYLTGQIAQLKDLAPHVPDELCAVVHRAMGPKPPDRYATVADLRSALEPFAIAARVPSAGLTATPLPGVATPHPAAASPVSGRSDPAPAPIPKTLPPTDDKPPPGVDTRASVPSLPNGHATPLGGFDGRPAGATSMAEPLPQGLAQRGPMGSSPYAQSSFNGGGAYEPQRAGGTAVGAAQMAGGGYPAAPGYTSVGGGYPAQGGYGAPGGYPGAQGYPGTAPMDPVPVAPTQGNKKRGGGSSFALMLVLAAAVTGLVVGGVYLSQQLRRSKDDSKTTPPITAPSTTVVAADPAGGPTTASTPAPTPQQPIPPTRPTTGTGTGTTKAPTGGGTPQPTASTSSTGQQFPTLPSAWPTSIPIPFPFPGGQPPPSNTSPAPTNTAPAPTNTAPAPTGTGSTRPRIRIPIPGQNP
ncbi:serine/threonine-protein kinase [Polyangium aurulentum]|uniref:serine/threonine-protein kinase n=1 Tax=Polyangium aurulentum TaxID=2567896 RepID=UPI0010ADF89F|nr:serine/threonine-protein kinase [Polyangium aurulentum]UQA58200.1 protein kinase [Polyangium aurulentum]